MCICGHLPYLFLISDSWKRTFRLFDLLGIKEGGSECPRLVPYYLIDEDGVCPKYFNDIQKFGAVDFKTDPDPYSVNKWLPARDPDRIDES